MGKYYILRAYVEDHQESINNHAIHSFAERICMLLGCQYDSFGYTLLHPDFDFKEMGKVFRNEASSLDLFKAITIPQVLWGKDGEPSAPTIYFRSRVNNQFRLPDFCIQWQYPIKPTAALIVKIDVNDKLLVDRITTEQFVDILCLIEEGGYNINSAFLHYCSGGKRRLLVDGFQPSVCYPGDVSLVNKAAKYQGVHYRNKLIDIFLINTIASHLVSSELKEAIKKTVGAQHVNDGDALFTFELPHSAIPFQYASIRRKLRCLLNNYLVE